MKNPLRELVTAIILLLLLLLVLLHFTRNKSTPTQTIESSIDLSSETVDRLTYLEIESTTALKNLAVTCGEKSLSNSPLNLGALIHAEEKLTFRDSECTLRIKAQSETWPISIRLRVEPEGLAHREQVLWIDGSHSEEVKFSWK